MIGLRITFVICLLVCSSTVESILPLMGGAGGLLPTLLMGSLFSRRGGLFGGGRRRPRVPMFYPQYPPSFRPPFMNIPQQYPRGWY